MNEFSLHPRLAADCIDLGSVGLSRLLLMDDARYPWCILVPQRHGLTEIHQLSDADQVELIGESSRLSRFLAGDFGADKMNVAVLGNLVPQLHVHHIVRYRDDATWPGPVWGIGTAKPYSRLERSTMVERVCNGLGLALPD